MSAELNMGSSGAGLSARFEGCLLGLAIGDALGGRFEAQSSGSIRARFPSVETLIEYPHDELWYTDDTQMMIGVAETLADHGAILEGPLCQAFVANYVPSRGYGRGIRAVLEAMEDGQDYARIAERYFPGGSLGNGAAMRVAPVGLCFRDDSQRLLAEARQSAWPTHRHPLGIEGAQILALAVGICARSFEYHREAFFREVTAACTSDVFRDKLDQASKASEPPAIAALGNGIEAAQSVPTAIACFAHASGSYEQAVGQAILLGGDTDTIAAMTGAMSGAFLGADCLPQRLLHLLENGPKGRDYLRQLAKRLTGVAA